MEEVDKGNISVRVFKVLWNYLIFGLILFAVIFAGYFLSNQNYIYESYPIKVRELKRFEYDNDTMIVLLIEYNSKDFVTTKIKHKE